MYKRNTSIGLEEEKSPSCTNQVNRYVQPIKEYINPLIHNKGSAHFSKESVIRGPIHTITSVSKNLPEIEGNSIEVIEKRSSIASAISEGCYSNISELDISDKLRKENNLFLPPLFEVHSALQLLYQTKSEGFATSHTSVKSQARPITIPRKSHSIRTEPKNNIPIESSSLNQPLKDFIKKVNEISTNYMSHVLNNRDVYFQYVVLSKTQFSFLNTELFNMQVEGLMNLKPQYEKNIMCYQGRLNIKKNR
jgi:hypothetical protein